MDVFGAVVAQARGALRAAAGHAAATLGLPEALSRPRPLDELAADLGAVRHKLGALLEVLALEGLVSRVGALWQWVGPVAAAAAPPAQGWGRLAEVIRGADPIAVAEPEIARRYHEHLQAVGAPAAAELAATCLAPGGPSLLDVGAGLGTYSAAFLAHRPDGRATLVDEPAVLEWARASLDAWGDRVTFVAGDFREVRPVSPVDLVLLANVLHLHGPDACLVLLARARAALRPGGTVVVKELRLDDDRQGPAAALYFSLNMALYTEAGRVYTASELLEWLDRAGFERPRVVALTAAPDALVIVARRPSSDSSADALAVRLGVGTHAPGLEALQAQLDTTAARTWERLATAGRLHPRALPARLELPAGFAEWLSAALALEQAEGTAEAAARAAQLSALYLEGMPALRVEQLAVADPPNGFLFHEPLEWQRLPRLSAALDRAFALLEAAAVPASALGATDADAFRARFSTLAELYAHTYFGRFMPFLYGYPADLRAYQRELDSAADPWAVFDRRLAAPILHELMHFGPDRRLLLPPYFDECVAGYLGVHLLPEFAYPALGQDNGLYGSPWFAQVGQALARVAGLEALVRAQVGVEPWETALPPGLASALERLGWTRYREQRGPHFLLDNVRPEPWMKLFYMAAGGEPLEALDLAALEARAFADIRVAGPPNDFDRLILEHALAAMCLHNTQVEDVFRVQTIAPPTPILIDLHACRVSRPSAADSLDPAPPAYLFPPHLAASLRAAGLTQLDVELAAPDEAAGIVDTLFADGSGRGNGRDPLS